MKKVVLILSILFCISISSCEKEYVCDCDKIYITGQSTGTSVENYTLYPYTDTKRRAESRCRENNTTNMDEGGAYDIKCKLK